MQLLAIELAWAVATLASFLIVLGRFTVDSTLDHALVPLVQLAAWTGLLIIHATYGGTLNALTRGTELGESPARDLIRARTHANTTIHIFNDDPIETGTAMISWRAAVLPRRLLEELTSSEVASLAAVQGGCPPALVVLLPLINSALSTKSGIFWSSVPVYLIAAAITPFRLPRLADFVCLRRPEDTEPLITALAKIHG